MKKLLLLLLIPTLVYPQIWIDKMQDTKVKSYNVLCEIVAKKTVVKTDSKTTLKVDLSSFAKEIYFIELESEKSIVKRKLILR